VTAIVTSISLQPDDKKHLEAILKARGFRNRSEYVRACIEADYLDLSMELAISSHNTRAKWAHKAIPVIRRKASTPRGKTK
jgi:Arc/MetJ-type ribon-helix-helix transcriptional regulator